MRSKSALLAIILLDIFGKMIAESNKTNVLQEFMESEINSTFVANEEKLLKKINAILKDGVDNLQIISDFDNTLTIDSDVEGKQVLNTFEMFRLCPSVPQTYKDEEYKLYQTYGPIESDPYLSQEEKSKYMLEWYMAANNLMKGIKFPRSEINGLGLNMTDCLRTGINDLVNWSIIKNVPFVILSSGLGDALKAILNAANISSLNLEVVSNFLDLNDDDIILGMKGSPIHSYNKNEASIKTTTFYDKIKDRKNVILLGDTIGDAKMADGLDNPSNIIKIAFLSRKRSTNLQLYLDNFDVVLYNDQTLKFLNRFLNKIH